VEKEIALDLAENVKLKLVLLPAGKFLMGSGPKELELVKRESGKTTVLGEQAQSDEDPQHEVTLSRPFYLGAFHVTRGQFAAFAAAGGYQTDAEREGSALAWDGVRWGKVGGASWKKPGFAQADDHPAVCLSHRDAAAFCQWLGRKAGKAIALPTEAQWEYACRAGTATAYQWGDAPDDGKGWANAADQTARKALFEKWSYFNWDDGFACTSPVGKFKPNNFGLSDMHGNACQWCSDWYDKGYYAKSPKADPPGPAGGAHRVLRGGGWFTPPLGCRSAARDRMMPDYRYSYFGFRVMCPDVAKP
jgi:formylglycine-generating enzyme required for sulfatase activity